MNEWDNKVEQDTANFIATVREVIGKWGLEDEN